MRISVPTTEALDELRRVGMRPQVVGCFVREGKLLFVYHKEYDLWQFPQGGIDNGETVVQALEREMTEELGATFSTSADYAAAEFFLKTMIDFPPHKHGSRELQTDAGEAVTMVGKTYFAALIPAGEQDVVLGESEFDDAIWLNGEEAYALIDRVYQRRKQAQMREIVDLLRKEGKLR